MTKRTWKQSRQITYDQMKVYGEQFQQLRESIGFSLTRMADELGIHRSSLHRWEKGKLIPQTDIKYLDRKIRSVAAKYAMMN